MKCFCNAIYLGGTIQDSPSDAKAALTDPDLWWALLGGGGGTFGIVTEMKLKAHPQPSGGFIIFALTHLISHPTDPQNGEKVYNKVIVTDTAVQKPSLYSVYKDSSEGYPLELTKLCKFHFRGLKPVSNNCQLVQGLQHPTFPSTWLFSTDGANFTGLVSHVQLCTQCVTSIQPFHPPPIISSTTCRLQRFSVYD